MLCAVLCAVLVLARASALNAFGGVKVDVFVRVRPQLDIEKGQENSIDADTEENTIELRDQNGHPTNYSYDKVCRAVPLGRDGVCVFLCMRYLWRVAPLWFVLPRFGLV